MKIITLPISELKPALYNPRKDLKPSDPEYQKIERSVKEFGYVDPIIVNKDLTIIGGHQRYKVLVDQGYKELDCVIMDLPKDREKALNIALNKISGDWNPLKLKDLLTDLDTGAFDIEITGFGKDEIEDKLKESTPADIDQLLSELDVSQSIEKPIWATIRTSQDKQEILDRVLIILEQNGIRVERSYDT